MTPQDWIIIAAVVFSGVSMAFSTYLWLRMRRLNESILAKTARLADVKTGSSETLLPDPYLGVPCRTVRASVGPRVYQPDIAGVDIEFLGRRFSPHAEPRLLKTTQSGPNDPVVLDLCGPALAPGDQLTVLDDFLHDFGVGTSFVRVARKATGEEGLLDAHTFFLETRNVSAPPDQFMTVPLENGELHLFSPMGPEDRDQCLGNLEKGDYETTFESPPGSGCNPTFASVQAVRALACALDPETTDEMRARIVKAGEKFFSEYAFPEASEVGGGVSWPLHFDFVINWMFTLKKPWFSGYAASVMAQNGAMMYELTGEDRYRDLAYGALDYVRTPLDKGGAAYEDGGFPFIAEYAYPSPPLPNARIFDGELISAVCVMGCAKLFKDSELARYAAGLCAGAANHISVSTTHDGLIQNARYPWLINEEGYSRVMKNCAIQLFRITKDRTFERAATDWRVSDALWR